MGDSTNNRIDYWIMSITLILYVYIKAKTSNGETLKNLKNAID